MSVDQELTEQIHGNFDDVEQLRREGPGSSGGRH
jgi:hypothetical protein